MSSPTEQEKDIVFCCKNCDKQIVRDSEDHDFSKCDETGEDWYCVDCPVPEEDDDESDDEGIPFAHTSGIRQVNIQIKEMRREVVQ